MKYLSFVSLLFFFAATGCKKANENNHVKVINGMYYFEKATDTIGPANTIFRYEFYWSDNARDVGGIGFRADSGVTEFSYQDSSLAKHYTAYSSGSKIGSYPYTLIYKGSMYGKKNADNTWTVSIDIVLHVYDKIMGVSGINESLIFKHF